METSKDQITPRRQYVISARATETRQTIARARTTCFPCDMELVRSDEAQALEFRRRQLELSRAVYSLVAVLGNPYDAASSIRVCVQSGMADPVSGERGSL